MRILSYCACALLMFLACCKKESPAPGPMAGPSEIVRRFDPEGALRRLRLLLATVSDSGSRWGLRIDPPGDHFATCFLVGESGPAGIEGILVAAQGIGEDHLRSLGARPEGSWDTDEASASAPLRQAILRTNPGPVLHSRRLAYAHDGHRGHITILATKEPDSSSWRIGLAVHEAARHG
jgi:hypothetical protein